MVYCAISAHCYTKLEKVSLLGFNVAFKDSQWYRTECNYLLCEVIILIGKFSVVEVCNI